MFIHALLLVAARPLFSLRTIEIWFDPGRYCNPQGAVPIHVISHDVTQEERITQESTACPSYFRFGLVAIRRCEKVSVFLTQVKNSEMLE